MGTWEERAMSTKAEIRDYITNFCSFDISDGKPNRLTSMKANKYNPTWLIIPVKSSY